MNLCATLALGALVILGDSNAQGPIRPEAAPGWAERFELAGCEVRNLAVPGSTAEEWTRWVTFLQPRVSGSTVILWLGTNDARDIRLPPATPAEYGDRMAFLADWALGRGALSVLLALPPPLADPLPEERERLRGYRAELRALCRATAAQCVTLGLRARRHLLPDGVHLNRCGQRRVFTRLWRYVTSTRSGSWSLAPWPSTGPP